MELVGRTALWKSTQTLYSFQVNGLLSKWLTETEDRFDPANEEGKEEVTAFLWTISSKSLSRGCLFNVGNTTSMKILDWR
ncbi:hypothetical protein N7461_000888 [Penicillium sp. DV-2018c]|nr:hypothetical protein N7461_000888 [Penicillium sp. DV-2018c]